MANSTNIIGDIGTVITNGPNAATTAKAIAPNGPIIDYVGMCFDQKVRAQYTSVLLNTIKTVTDATDSANLALINKLLALFNGTSTPSTTALADINTVIANGPNAATIAKAIAAGGPIQDYVGNTHNVRRMIQELKVFLGPMVTDTDATDSANLALLQNIVSVIT